MVLDHTTLYDVAQTLNGTQNIQYNPLFKLEPKNLKIVIEYKKTKRKYISTLDAKKN